MSAVPALAHAGMVIAAIATDATHILLISLPPAQHYTGNMCNHLYRDQLRRFGRVDLDGFGLYTACWRGQVVCWETRAG
jgi:hypothetical protein